MPAPFLDQLANRQPLQAVRRLKGLQVGDRRPHFAGVVRPERNQFCHRAIVLGDDESFTRLYALEESRQMGLGFKGADFGDEMALPGKLTMVRQTIWRLSLEHFPSY